MDMMNISLIGLTLLLAGFCVCLHIRMTRLMRALRETGPVLRAFSESVDRAERAFEMSARERDAVTVRRQIGIRPVAKTGQADLIGRFFPSVASEERI